MWRGRRWGRGAPAGWVNLGARALLGAPTAAAGSLRAGAGQLARREVVDPAPRPHLVRVAALSRRRAVSSSARRVRFAAQAVTAVHAMDEAGSEFRLQRLRWGPWVGLAQARRARAWECGMRLSSYTAREEAAEVLQRLRRSLASVVRRRRLARAERRVRDAAAAAERSRGATEHRPALVTPGSVTPAEAAALHNVELDAATDRTGDCQYSSVASDVLGDATRHAEVRAAGVAELRARPHLYAPFVEVGRDGVPLWEYDAARPHDYSSFLAFVDTMAERGTHGCNVTLAAVARVYRRAIEVISARDASVHVHSVAGESVGRPIRVVHERETAFAAGHYHGAVAAGGVPKAAGGAAPPLVKAATWSGVTGRVRPPAAPAAPRAAQVRRAARPRGRARGCGPAARRRRGAAARVQSEAGRAARGAAAERWAPRGVGSVGAAAEEPAAQPSNRFAALESDDVEGPVEVGAAGVAGGGAPTDAAGRRACKQERRVAARAERRADAAAEERVLGAARARASAEAAVLGEARDLFAELPGLSAAAAAWAPAAPARSNAEIVARGRAAEARRDSVLGECAACGARAPLQAGFSNEQRGRLERGRAGWCRTCVAASCEGAAAPRTASVVVLEAERQAALGFYEGGELLYRYI